MTSTRSKILICGSCFARRFHEYIIERYTEREQARFIGEDEVTYRGGSTWPLFWREHHPNILRLVQEQAVQTVVVYMGCNDLSKICYEGRGRSDAPMWRERIYDWHCQHLERLRDSLPGVRIICSLYFPRWGLQHLLFSTVARDLNDDLEASPIPGVTHFRCPLTVPERGGRKKGRTWGKRLKLLQTDFDEVRGIHLTRHAGQSGEYKGYSPMYSELDKIP